MVSEKSMANLRPVRDPEEAARRGRNGAAKTASIKRERRTMRETLQAVIDAKASDTYGLEDIFSSRELKNLTVSKAVALHQVAKALQGDTKAAAFIRDTAEGRPSENHVISFDADAPLMVADIDSIGIREKEIYIVATSTRYIVESGQSRTYWKWARENNENAGTTGSPKELVAESVKLLREKVEEGADGELAGWSPSQFNDYGMYLVHAAFDFLRERGMLADFRDYAEDRDDRPDYIPIPVDDEFFGEFLRLYREADEERRADDGDGRILI